MNVLAEGVGCGKKDPEEHLPSEVLKDDLQKDAEDYFRSKE